MPKKYSKARLDDAILQSPDSQSANDNSNVDNPGRRHSMIEPKLEKGNIDKNRKTKSKTNAPAELKGLQDSLSHFFTPSEMRRSRASSFKLSIDQPLEIAIDHPGPSAASKSISSNVSSKSYKTEAACSSSYISPKSPHRRDQLEDALTKYFTPNPDKRRLHKEGEYWQMSRGESSAKTANDASSTNKDEIMEEEEDQAQQNDLADECEMPHASKPKQEEEDMPKSKKLSSNKSIEAAHAPKPIQKKKGNAAAIKKAQLIKRAYKGTRNPRKKMTQPVSSSLKFANQPTTNTITNYFRPLKPSKITLTNVKSEGDVHSQEITEEDRALFEEARKVVQKDLDATNNALKQNPNAIFPPKIRIHCYEITTWYSAPYPQEYACLPVLHICDACLMYLSIPSSHYRKCKMEYPPGNEIYRCNNFSVFEVDGNQARVYCRNLCLLAKLFIDHKTLYFDVEPFLFYVLTLNDETGSHFVGYFSKEKYSSQKYNLACIMTLPCYQGRGFGRFLIDFSYLLSRREGLIGSPERPLSDLGQVAYQSYWLSAIFEYFYRQLQENNRMKQISLMEISNSTAIAPSDIAETFAENLMLQTKDSKTTLVLDEAIINAHWERAKSNEKRIWLDEEKLKWAPKVYSPFKEYQMGSPTFTPLPSITTPNKLIKDLEEDEEMQKSSKNRKDLSKNETQKKPRKKPQIDEEIVENGPKRTGKIGRKKSPEKKIKQDLSTSSETEHTNEEEIQKPRKLSPGKGNKKQRGNCKEGMEKMRKKRASSSDDDDDDDDGRMGGNQSKRLSKHLAQSLSLNGAAQSTSNASENKTPRKSKNEKCTISRPREKMKFNASPTSSSSTSSENEQDEEMEVDLPRMKIGHKKVDRRTKKYTKRIADDDDDETETSSLSSNDEIESKKRGKMKKRRNMKKSSNSSASSISSNSTKEEPIMDTPNNNLNKKRRKSIQNRVQQSSMEEEEEEDRSLCSSASPPPNGDRLPIFKQSTKELDNLLVNMGGEPDTINMGGEPGDDVGSNEGAAPNSFSTVVADLSAFKTPLQLRTDAEDEVGEEQPTIGQKQHLMHFSQINIESEIANKPKEISHVQQIQTKTTANNNKITLKLPNFQINQPHLKSCSPSEIATVEMPALERTENRTLFGDEPAEEDDETPPMLSPQAENINNGMVETTLAAAIPISTENISGADSSIINDDQIGAMMEDNAQQPDTSSSSIELVHSSPTEHKKSYETPNKQQNIISPSKTQNELAFQIPPLTSSVHEDYQKTIQQNIPQIRVRSESNAEFSAQPIVNKLQRTSSFSGHGNANNANEQQTSQQPNVQTNLSALSLPTIHEQIYDNSSFVVPPYNNQYNAPAQTSQQQLSSTKIAEKPKEKGGKKGTTTKEKTGTAKSGNVKTQKTGTTTKQPQQQSQIVQQSGNSTAFASPSSTSAFQLAQFAQYYQQQYPSYQQQFGAMNISQQQMNNNQSSSYGQQYAAFYNQAAAWQWQMQAQQAAAKFQQQNPAAAAAYQNFPHEFSSQWMSMVNGAATSGSTAAVASTLNSAPSIPTNVNWPPGFTQNAHQIRHHSSTSQSHLGNFYPTPHHP